jgi:hypothetical protein
LRYHFEKNNHVDDRHQKTETKLYNFTPALAFGRVFLQSKQGKASCISDFIY